MEVRWEEMVVKVMVERELPCGRPKRVKVIPEQGSRRVLVVVGATESCIRYDLW